MKLSVIIPVYRVEDTIRQCVESVVRQDYDDMEVLLIDDGSPDKCPEICDEMAGKYPFVKVMHQDNQGLSGARNTGIALAGGEYITFVDSDDYIGEDTWKTLMKTLEEHPEYDILEYPVVKEESGHVISELMFEDRVYKDKTAYWNETEAYLHSYAWNKIYRRKLFGSVRYPVGKIFEDMYTLPLLLQQTSTIATTASGRYYYRRNTQGISARAGQNLRMLLDAHLETFGEYPSDRYYIHILNIQLDVMELTGDPPSLPQRRICDFRGMDIKQKVKSIIFNLFGIRVLCNINKVIHKLRNHHW